MEPFDPQPEPDVADPPVQPRLPRRISILTGPPAPSASPPVPGQWLHDQPYGASANARYAVAGASRGRRWRRLLLPIVVIALVAGGTAVVFRDKLFNRDSAPTYPDVWEPRVADIAQFVQDERDLQWEHPVFVDFLTEADFVALFDQPTTMSDEQAATARAYSQLYDAFGLAANYDVTQGAATLSAVTTLGFYSVEKARVYVRGDQLTPAVRVVLAHELTHALQAQHFDLATGGPNDLELRSVVEADALRVADAYRGVMSPADLADADEGNHLAPDAEENLSDVPWAVVEQRAAPYVLGPMLVGDVFAASGNAGVDRLIIAPPTEEVLLNPWTYSDVAQEDVAVNVEAPVGTRVLDKPQPLSQLDMLMMLDAWLPWSQARGALKGWAGSGYTSYQRADAVCFTATVTFDDSADQFAAAVAAWAKAAGSAATPITVVNDVTFEACSRGPGAAAPPTPVVTPLQALTLEHEAIRSAGGATPSEVQIRNNQCFVATMVDDPLLAPLLFLDTRTVDEQSVFIFETTLAANACSVPPPNF